MGVKLLNYYDEARKMGGFTAAYRLAMLTLIPSAKAMEEPDSAENIEKFEKAMQTLRENLK